MAKQSAGILLYRIQQEQLEVLLVYPGGPYFAGKENAGNWSIPKGEFMEGEAPFDAAVREMEEETGYRPQGDFIELTPIQQKSGKKVYCWAVAGDLSPDTILSNTFEIEWPPKSGKKKSYPEIDKAEWFTIATAQKKINEKQSAFLDELQTVLKNRGL